jgi:hypothetical protein
MQHLLQDVIEARGGPRASAVKAHVVNDEQSAASRSGRLSKTEAEN